MNRKLKLEELNRLSTNDFKSKKKDPVVVLLDNVSLQCRFCFQDLDAMALKNYTWEA